MPDDQTKTLGNTATDRSIRNHMLAGSIVLFGVLGGFGAWSALAEISGAVIAPGHIAVETRAKKVQHPEGGVVAELKVREGDRVKVGDLLARLDDTVLRANLAMVSKALDELTALEARLIAERDGLGTVRFPRSLIERAKSNTDAEASIGGQQIIFDSRRTARETARTQLSEQIAQLESLIEGLSAQRAAREQELKLIAEELKGVRDLFAEKLVPLTRVIALDRDRTRIEGERGKLISDTAAARGSIAEKKIQIVRLDDEFRSEVVTELADVRNKINEDVERKAAATERLSRIEIRAPVSGMIHQLNVFTIGGVIASGEVAMLIVPENDKLVVDAQVEPQEIEHLRIGQKAVVSFTAFSDRNLKDAAGEVTVISPDLVEEQQTQRRFYRVKMSVEPPIGSNGQPLTLVPGMPVEAFIVKGNRTVLAYLVKPIKDQMQRIFRE
jgi:HlyD family secretion protein